jgi:hypothetical protein
MILGLGLELDRFGFDNGFGLGFDFGADQFTKARLNLITNHLLERDGHSCGAFAGWRRWFIYHNFILSFFILFPVVAPYLKTFPPPSLNTFP